MTTTRDKKPDLEFDVYAAERMAWLSDKGIAFVDGARWQHEQLKARLQLLHQVQDELRDFRLQWERIAKEVIPGEKDSMDVINHMLKERDSLKAENEKLRAVLNSLANEAAGFLHMADYHTHGRTNMECLRVRIEEAREALKGSEE